VFDARGARIGASLVLLMAAAGLYWGWQVHWFMTDDAFIAFRFIDNRRAGYGYTWNPPPFFPVEGYTSFGWVLLLDAIWSVSGVTPPEIANDVSLACALGTLALTSWASHRLCSLRGISGGAAIAATAAVLFATITNRTFLVWSSSGLETALFNLLLQSWLLVALLSAAGDQLRPRTLATICGLASGIELTRPDGLLPVASSGAMILVCVTLGVVSVRAAFACALPLLLVAAHLLWRHSFYGEWLPNTYYAKVVAPWPEAGLRYFAVFGLEYAYYLALPVWLIGAWLWERDAMRRILAASGSERMRSIARLLVQAGALATVFAMLGFEVLIAGGDHFEYRALSFLCPLLALALWQGLLALGLRASAGAITVAGFSLISAVLPWTIFAQTNALYAWPPSPAVEPIADETPWIMRPVATRLDELENWLIPRGIGLRHYEHRAFWLHQLQNLPDRNDGARACSASDHPIAAFATIGIASWVLPNCAILDLRGLADYVIARTPSQLEYLGHDRRAPPGYMEAFQPNVASFAGGVRIYPRPKPLTDDMIRAIEAHYRSLLHERD
jgi:arabinofuranosyltransferase